MLDLVASAHAQGMHGGHIGAGLLASLVPMIVISIPFAIGFYFVAGRLGRNKWAWLIVSLIPVVNYFFWIYAFFVIILGVLDRLNGIQGAVVPGEGAGSARNIPPPAGGG